MTVHDASVTICPPPLTGTHAPKLAVLSSYVTAAASVAILPNGISIGDEGAVAADGMLMLSSLFHHTRNIFAHPAWRLPRSEARQITIPGTLAVVTHHGPRNFGHVLADGLPRIWLVRRAGIEPDAWLIADEAPTWLDELLSIAGIPPKNRILGESLGSFECLFFPVLGRPGPHCSSLDHKLFSSSGGTGHESVAENRPQQRIALHPFRQASGSFADPERRSGGHGILRRQAG